MKKSNSGIILRHVYTFRDTFDVQEGRKHFLKLFRERENNERMEFEL